MLLFPELVFQADDDAYCIYLQAGTQVVRSVNMFLLPQRLMRVAKFTDQVWQFRHVRRPR